MNTRPILKVHFHTLYENVMYLRFTSWTQNVIRTHVRRSKDVPISILHENIRGFLAFSMDIETGTSSECLM